MGGVVANKKRLAVVVYVVCTVVSRVDDYGKHVNCTIGHCHHARVCTIAYVVSYYNVAKVGCIALNEISAHCCALLISEIWCQVNDVAMLGNY